MLLKLHVLFTLDMQLLQSQNKHCYNNCLPSLKNILCAIHWGLKDKNKVLAFTTFCQFLKLTCRGELEADPSVCPAAGRT